MKFVRCYDVDVTERCSETVNRWDVLRDVSHSGVNTRGLENLS